MVSDSSVRGWHEDAQELDSVQGHATHEDHFHVILLVASDRRVPRSLVKLPPTLKGHLDLAASLGLEVGIELLHADVAVAVGIKALEHGVVHVHLAAVTLRQAHGTEGTSELVDVELAVAVSVEVGEDLLHVVLLVAGNRRVPGLLVKIPPQVDFLVDFGAQSLGHVVVELLHGHEAVAVRVEGLAADAGGGGTQMEEWAGVSCKQIREGVGFSVLCSPRGETHNMALSISAFSPARFVRPMARKARAIS